MRTGRCATLFLGALLMVATGTPAVVAASSRSVTEQVLYNFCAQAGCIDGSNPYAGLVMDAAGNLYGTTYESGGSLGGTVFQLAPSGIGWTETVLYRFCQDGSSCSDGSNPRSGLLMDASGDLFGTTASGGASGGGTVFQFAPTGTGWNHSILI
jgi:uncharacterized repeat protein (TIGR03803 family)